MLDLNHILLFIACLSPFVVLLRSARQGGISHTWRWAALAVLFVTGLGYLIAPARAGFIGGGAWFFILFLPTLGLRKAAALSSLEQFRTARRILGLVRFVHPTPWLDREWRLLRALELGQRGQLPASLALLDSLAATNTFTVRRAQAHVLRLRGDWMGLLAWCRENLPRVGLGGDPTLLPLYLRALAEMGLHDEMVLQFAGRSQSLLASPIHQPTYLLCLLTVLAFSGRAAAVRKLLGTGLRKLPPEAKEDWIARSQMAAGLVSPPNESSVDRFARGADRVDWGRASSSFTPAVATILALNLVMFAGEILFGGTTNPLALHRLGALEPSAVISGGEYWRLLNALFLHYGALHLLVNLYALYVLGPALENTIGSVRFALAYFLSGIGSSLGVVILWRLGYTEADFLVGASGAVMGVVGTWAGLLVAHRHLPMARRRLLPLGVIIVIQIFYDLYSPQTSMAAHLCGLACGMILGLMIALRPKPGAEITPSSSHAQQRARNRAD